MDYTLAGSDLELPRSHSSIAFSIGLLNSSCEDLYKYKLITLLLLSFLAADQKAHVYSVQEGFWGHMHKKINVRTGI